MKPLPHHYLVAASGSVTGTLALSAPGLPDLSIAAPPEYDGPGDRWSPETLLCASMASCFILTFRAVARASKLEWSNLECAVEGTLERTDGVTRFTRLTTKATLVVDASVDQDLCRRAMEKAERGCLITNSLNGDRHLEATVRLIGSVS